MGINYNPTIKLCIKVFRDHESERDREAILGHLFHLAIKYGAIKILSSGNGTTFTHELTKGELDHIRKEVGELWEEDDNGR